MDKSHEASTKLMKQLLCRILSPADALKVVESGSLEAAADLLNSDDIDIGVNSRIALTQLEDTHSDLLVEIVTHCASWIQAFIQKMLKSLPFEDMALFRHLNPRTLNATKPTDCK